MPSEMRGSTRCPTGCYRSARCATWRRRITDVLRGPHRAGARACTRALPRSPSSLKATSTIRWDASGTAQRMRRHRRCRWAAADAHRHLSHRDLLRRARSHRRRRQTSGSRSTARRARARARRATRRRSSASASCTTTCTTPTPRRGHRGPASRWPTTLTAATWASSRWRATRSTPSRTPHRRSAATPRAALSACTRPPGASPPMTNPPTTTASMATIASGSAPTRRCRRRRRHRHRRRHHHRTRRRSRAACLTPTSPPRRARWSSAPAAIPSPGARTTVGASGSPHLRAAGTTRRPTTSIGLTGPTRSRAVAFKAIITAACNR